MLFDLNERVCITQYSTTKTQGQGHTSRLFDSAEGDLSVIQTSVLSFFFYCCYSDFLALERGKNVSKYT